MTHASLFSGIGGPEVAAAMLGWENLFHCEINPFGRKVLQFYASLSNSTHSHSCLPLSSRLSHLTSHLPIKLWETPSIWKGTRHLSGNYSKVHISPCQYRKWLCVKVLFLGVERINCI